MSCALAAAHEQAARIARFNDLARQAMGVACTAVATVSFLDDGMARLVADYRRPMPIQATHGEGCGELFPAAPRCYSERYDPVPQ